MRRLPSAQMRESATPAHPTRAARDAAEPRVGSPAGKESWWRFATLDSRAPALWTLPQQERRPRQSAGRAKTRIAIPGVARSQGERPRACAPPPRGAQGLRRSPDIGQLCTGLGAVAVRACVAARRQGLRSQELPAAPEQGPAPRRGACAEVFRYIMLAQKRRQADHCKRACALDQPRIAQGWPRDASGLTRARVRSDAPSIDASARSFVLLGL